MLPRLTHTDVILMEDRGWEVEEEEVEERRRRWRRREEEEEVRHQGDTRKERDDQ